MNKIKTSEKKCTCQECQNTMDLSETKLQIRDIVECKFCGMEYTMVNVSVDNGREEYELEELVEKK